MKQENRVEAIVYLLFAGMVFFTAMLFVCEHFFPNDGQIFQVIAGILSGFTGAFFMRIKPRQESGLHPSPPDQTVTATLDGGTA